MLRFRAWMLNLRGTIVGRKITGHGAGNTSVVRRRNSGPTAEPTLQLPWSCTELLLARRTAEPSGRVMICEAARSRGYANIRYSPGG